jgi:hypothetical protein
MEMLSKMGQGFIFADSNNRNPSESSNAYHLELVSPIKNITKIELVSAKVPNSMYNVTTGTLNVGSSSFTIVPGFYNACGLATQVSAQTSLTVNYECNTGKFTFWSSGPFTLQAVSSDLQKVLGLVPGVHTGILVPTGVYSHTSDNVADLSTNDFIFLDIEEFRTPSMIDCKSYAGNTFSGSTVNTLFGAVPLDVPSGSIKFFKETSDYKMSVSFRSPIGTVSRLTIRWLDRNGVPLNFNGLDDNSFLLRYHSVREPSAERLETPEPVVILKPPPPPEKKTKYYLMGGAAVLVAILLWFFLARSHTNQSLQPPSNYSRIPMRPR